MNALSEAMRASAEAVLEQAADLNRLDAQAGDGDLGVTMAAAAQIVIDMLPELDGQPLADVLRTCGATLARETPSTSGTLVATGLLRAARAAGDGVGLAPLLDAARAGIAERGKAGVGDKTMLDALAPAAEAAADAAARGDGPEDQLAAAAAAADAGAKATVDMQPRHGRAGWLSERSVGHEDGGARVVAIMLAGAMRPATPQA